MTHVLMVFCCAQCSTSHFPRPVRCRACGGGRFRSVQAPRGVVEEVTGVRSAAGAETRGPPWLATVRLADGLRLVSGLSEPLARDTEVQLDQRDGIISARPAVGLGG